jgi:hypothetical protein
VVHWPSKGLSADFRNQRIALWMFNAIHVEIDVESRPEQMVTVMHLDIEQLVQGHLAKPWEIIEIQKYSRSAMSTQKPCRDTFKTSTVEVPAPMISDFILSFLYNAL